MMNDLIAALRNIAERDEATGIASRLAAAIDTPPCKAEDDGTHEGAIKGWITRRNGGKHFNGENGGVYYKGSAPLPKSFQPGGTKSKYRMLRNQHVLDKLNGKDGTFDLKSGNPKTHDGGFQVAFQTFDSEDPSSPGYLSDEAYDKRVESLKTELGVEPDLGTFGIPEISFNVKNLNQAMELAKRYNQHSIFNWKTFRCKINKDYNPSTNKIMR